MRIAGQPENYWTVKGQHKVSDLPSLVHQVQSGEICVEPYASIDLTHWREANQSEIDQAMRLRNQAGLSQVQGDSSAREAGTAFKVALGSLGVATLAAVAHSPVMAGLAMAAGLGSAVYSSVLGAHGRSAHQESVKATEEANRLEQPKQLESGSLRKFPQSNGESTLLYRGQEGPRILAGDANDGIRKALQAYQEGTRLDGNYSHESRALYTIAAAIAGDQTASAAALGLEMDGNYSHKSRATFTIAAAIAGSEGKARQAYTLGSQMDGNYSHASRATYSEAAAIAGDATAARQAEDLGKAMDGNYSHLSRAIFTAAAAVAGSPEKARQADELGRKFDGNYSHESRATFTLAAAIAGTPEKAELANRLGMEFDRGYSHVSRSLFTVAAAIAGDEEKARTAFALGQEMDGNYSAHSRARFTIAAAAALNPDNAKYAAIFPKREDD